MKVRSIEDAKKRYLEPLKLAASCLSPSAHIQSYEGFRLGSEGYWELNGDGLSLTTEHGEKVVIEAEQRFKVIECDPAKYDGKYRVTTRMYSYSLNIGGTDLLRMDWHPHGNSPVFRPHVHTQPDFKVHQFGGRATFEDFVLTCFEYGVTPARDDFEQVLGYSKDVHEFYRSWHGSPPTE